MEFEMAFQRVSKTTWAGQNYKLHFIYVHIIDKMFMKWPHSSSIRGLTGPLPIKMEYFLNGLIRELDFEHMTNKMADLIFNDETLCMHAQIWLE